MRSLSTSAGRSVVDMRSLSTSAGRSVVDMRSLSTSAVRSVVDIRSLSTSAGRSVVDMRSLSTGAGRSVVDMRSLSTSAVRSVVDKIRWDRTYRGSVPFPRPHFQPAPGREAEICWSEGRGDRGAGTRGSHCVASSFCQPQALRFRPGGRHEIALGVSPGRLRSPCQKSRTQRIKTYIQPEGLLPASGIAISRAYRRKSRRGRWR